METPLISIITVVYNGESVLEKTIQSVISQTYSNIEYIIIDGASSDNTVSIIRKYEAYIKHWETNKNASIGEAFNRGIKHASGAIVGLLNASDWYEPTAVETVVNNIGDYDISYSNLRFWKNDKALFFQDANHALLVNEMTINHPTVFVTKMCYEKMGGFDETLRCAMDYDLLLRLKVNGFRFIHIHSVIANMQLDGLSNQKWFLACTETLAIKNKYLPAMFIKNHLYFVKHVLAVLLPRILEGTPLFRLIKFYRAHYAPIRKEYYDNE